MRFEEAQPISREEAAQNLVGPDRDLISSTLVRLALHDKERPWLESLMVQFMRHEDPWIRGVAAMCVGHIARIHGQIDQTAILPLLQSLLNDPATAGKARDALDDIEIYISRRAR
jgi:hypothetical protein